MYTPKTEYAFDKDITQRLAYFQKPVHFGIVKWGKQNVFFFCGIAAIIFIIMFSIPNRFFSAELYVFSLTLGTLGCWRFGWWFTHAMRAEFYRRHKWPPIRKKAQKLWDEGWRPKRLHIQMTTYFEEPSITKRVIGSILGQIRREKIPTTLYIGTGSAYDECVIREFAETYAQDIPDDLAKLVFIRQNQPGKRMAIGLILRAINRNGIDKDDLVIFMDGDALYGDDVLEKSLSIFGIDPELQALTTDEEVICYGPKWINSWLNMRFAQRRLAMQSHAVSDKVLTLTGRMSVFRAQHMLNLKFIRTIEADHLDHWLWGRFRFLSGDDKSTWYHMLCCEAKMAYVPDATVYTIEVIKENGFERMVQNFRRWSGNMLRNGSRAIALGPRKLNPFIWWCVVDQRIAMWTMLVGPILSMMMIWVEPVVFWGCIIWIVGSRLILCMFLYTYSRYVDMSWPFILYINQLTNALVKVYMLFHLSKQKWSNRGNQSSSDGVGLKVKIRNHFAKFQLISIFVGFLYMLMIYAGLVPFPFVL